MIHSVAKTTLAVPTRRQVWPSTSLGRVEPGLELVEGRTGVECRRPRRRCVVICVSRQEDVLSLPPFRGNGYSPRPEPVALCPLPYNGLTFESVPFGPERRP